MYLASCDVLVLKAPVSLLIGVMTWLLVEVLVKVEVSSTSGILLNDMAILEIVLVNKIGDEENNKELEPEMEG